MNLLALFLQYLPQLMKAAVGVQEIFDYIKRVREAAKQTGEWTPEAEQAFNEEIEQLKSNPPPWWRPQTGA